LPENLSTLEELSDILDAIFRQKVPLVAAEAFIDYWNISYSRTQVPKQGWPPAIQHCLSSVGLLPQEVEEKQKEEKQEEEQEEEPILEPAFVATVPLPCTPLAASLTIPAILKREEFTTIIQSPQRPQKIFGSFPIIPSSPVSPLVGRSSDLSRRRTPLSSIQLCGSPSKRRRLAIGHEAERDEKENVVVSVVDRIAAITPGAAKKRKREEDDEVEEQKSGPLAKKLKSSMKSRTRSMSKKASQHASPTCSVASSNESEDERQWVEATLTQRIPSPVTETQDETCDGLSTPVLPPRKLRRTVENSKHRLFPYVLIPPRKKPKLEREHATSLDVNNLLSRYKTLDLKMSSKGRMRSVSIPEPMLSSKTEKKRKRQESDAGDGDEDLYDLVPQSDPLPALQLSLPPPPVRQLRKAYSLPSSDSDVSLRSRSSSSDDDPYIGQVTPRHLISPILKRRVSSMTSRRTGKMPLAMGFGERLANLVMPGSDDSLTMSGSEQESPTKGVVTRQMMRMRNGSLKS
jgi:hypothetical protein